MIDGEDDAIGGGVVLARNPFASRGQSKRLGFVASGSFAGKTGEESGGIFDAGMGGIGFGEIENARAGATLLG